MKILIAFRFTGEDPIELKETLGKISSTFRNLGHAVYCSIEDEDDFKGQKKTNKEIMEHAFSECDTADLVFAFIRSNSMSEGMILELGYMKGKGKPFAVARKRGIWTTSIHEMADPFIEFDELEDLLQQIEQQF